MCVCGSGVLFCCFAWVARLQLSTRHVLLVGHVAIELRFRISHFGSIRIFFNGCSSGSGETQGESWSWASSSFTSIVPLICPNRPGPAPTEPLPAEWSSDWGVWRSLSGEWSLPAWLVMFWKWACNVARCEAAGFTEAADTWLLRAWPKALIRCWCATKVDWSGIIDARGECDMKLLGEAWPSWGDRGEFWSMPWSPCNGEPVANKPPLTAPPTQDGSAWTGLPYWSPSGYRTHFFLRPISGSAWSLRDDVDVFRRFSRVTQCQFQG